MFVNSNNLCCNATPSAKAKNAITYKYMGRALSIISLIGSIFLTAYLYPILGSWSFTICGAGFILYTALLSITANTTHAMPSDPDKTTKEIKPQDNEPKDPNSYLIPFYTNGGKDICGRTFDEILKQDDNWLEAQHNYIQWLFPSEKSSAFNLDSPTLNQELIKDLKTNPQAQSNLTAAYIRMMLFYGFNFDTTPQRLTRSKNYQVRFNNWLTNSHNHLRLTRIMQFLCLMDRQDLALLLFNELEKIYIETSKDKPGPIAKTTYEKFWRKAAPLQ